MTDYLDRTIDTGDEEFASLYDETSFWSSRFGAFLVDHLELRRGESVLDVGCATGFPLFELANACGRSSRLVGCDIWTAAIGRAEAKRRRYSRENVSLVCGDGSSLPFSDASFDLIVSNLGVNNFADLAKALRECRRVARPGGRLVVTTNPRGHMREFYAVFREVLAGFGKPSWVERIDRQEAHRVSKESLAALFETAGFTVARAIESSFAIRAIDAAALLDNTLTRIGFLGGWRSVVDDPGERDRQGASAQKREVEREVFRRLEAALDASLTTGAGIAVTVPMLYLEGIRR